MASEMPKGLDEVEQQNYVLLRQAQRLQDAWGGVGAPGTMADNLEEIAALRTEVESLKVNDIGRASTERVLRGMLAVTEAKLAKCAALAQRMAPRCDRCGGYVTLAPECDRFVRGCCSDALKEVQDEGR